MSTVWKLKIDQETLERANRVTERMGTSTQEMVRIFVSQIAESGRIPLKLEPGDDLILDRARRNKLLLSLDDSEGW
jgi:addiction module RelB/DinJ family antitoxin